MREKLSASVIFCDDIREEVGNRVTIVGVMSDAVYLDTVPAILPKFGIYARIRLPIDYAAKNILFRILEPSGAGNAIGLFDADMIEKSRQDAIAARLPDMSFVVRAVAVPFQINVEGFAKIEIDIDSKTIEAGELRFSVGSPPIDVSFQRFESYPVPTKLAKKRRQVSP